MNFELRAMRGARSYLRHEVIRQLTSEFDMWGHEIDKDYFVRKCQQHCEYFFMSTDEAELTSWTEWRYIMDEVMSFAEGMATHMRSSTLSSVAGTHCA